jgi:ribosomal protein RSM22 (predicted rRNA methylase)
LAEALTQLTTGCDQKLLALAAARLSEKYRQPATQTASSIQKQNAWPTLATRMPATYAAAHKVISEVQRLMPDVSLKSLLDSMAQGTGAATWRQPRSSPICGKSLCSSVIEIYSIGATVGAGG